MCCLSGEPLDENERGKHSNPNRKIVSPHYQNKFQTDMMGACCANCPWSCIWCGCQFVPFTCGVTQCALRRKLLDGDMSQYSCFQGQFSCCCGMVGAGKCGESNCPSLCLCLEAHCCNGLALSASRNVMMEHYELTADPCDNRLIRCSNCMQILSCFCHILAIIDGSFRDLAQIIDLIADIIYHTVSGCMTAQVATEIDYQKAQHRFPISASNAGPPRQGGQGDNYGDNAYNAPVQAVPYNNGGNNYK